LALLSDQVNWHNPSDRVCQHALLMGDVLHDDVIFDHENPVTVHDILWSWSTGYLPTHSAIAMLHLDDERELYEAADDNDVPYPCSASENC
jgi:hypothetical protein